MIYKRCSRCGKRLEAGQTCECVKQRHKEYDKYSRDKEAKAFYNSPNWLRMRQYILDKYDNIDVYVYIRYGQIEKADTVHHIWELSEEKAQALSEKNLIPVSSATHSLIHSEYAKSEENKKTMQATLYYCLRRMQLLCTP